ncbi:hypothetical protein WME91_54465 [Sorangium sp. So ce269]
MRITSAAPATSSASASRTPATAGGATGRDTPSAASSPENAAPKLASSAVAGVPNYGIVLEEDATASTQWRASEDTTPSRRPRLEVCYAE